MRNRRCFDLCVTLCAGFHRKYIKYTVTTSTDLKTFGYSPVQVVRRFSDFVDLEHLLRVRCPTTAAARRSCLLPWAQACSMHAPQTEVDTERHISLPRSLR